MENDGKKHLICAFLIIFIIGASALFIIISKHAFAQTLYDRRLSELADQTTDDSIWLNSFQIHVGDRPQLIAVNDPTNTIYVVNRNFGEVSVIDGWSHRKIGEDIPVGDGPVAIAIDANTNTVYVANYHSNTVSVIDARDNTKIRDIPVGRGPAAMIVNPNTNTVYVANNNSNTVSVIDGTTYNLTRNIPVGLGPVAIDVNLSTNTTYVANSRSHSVSVINATNNLKTNIQVGLGPKDIAINYPLNKIYVANSRSDSVSVINGSTDDPSTLERTISVGRGPAAMIVNPNTNTLYVVNSLNNTVSVIYGNDTKREDDIAVGNRPREVDINPTINTLYIVNSGSGSDTVSVIDGANNSDIKKLDDIQVRAEPWDVSYNRRTNATYIVNAASDSISLIDGFDNKVLAGIILQVNPFNSGYIQCDGSNTSAPINQFFFVEEPGMECVAKPYEGYEFASWEENLDNNSTQMLTVFRPQSYWNLWSPNADEPQSKLYISRFGTFTANFRELPPPIPQEYMLLFVSTLVTSIASLATAIVVGRLGSKKK